MGNVHEKDSGVLTEALIRECARMELEPKEVMVVTLSPMVVAAAKAKEMHTTALKNGSKNGKAQRQAHFKIEELLHLKDVVEGLNGISYRRMPLWLAVRVEALIHAHEKKSKTIVVQTDSELSLIFRGVPSKVGPTAAGRAHTPRFHPTLWSG